MAGKPRYAVKRGEKVFFLVAKPGVVSSGKASSSTPLPTDDNPYPLVYVDGDGVFGDIYNLGKDAFLTLEQASAAAAAKIEKSLEKAKKLVAKLEELSKQPIRHEPLK